MNIFYLDQELDKIAEYHADRHVIKMPVESAQMCSTVARERCGIDVGYKSVFINHPCTRWTAASRENWSWNLSLATWLCAEYTHRWGNIHATTDVIVELTEHKNQILKHLPDVPFTEPPKVVSAEFKHLPTVDAYRQYYIVVKQRLHKWTNRPIPEWIPNE
jgi:hypothetical protein